MPEPGEPVGWLLLEPDSVPAAWQSRVRTVAQVPLLPGEVALLLELRRRQTDLNEDFASLVAAGRSRQEIGRRLGLSSRTVDRRFADLRELLGVSSPAEVVAELRRRGW